jgi:hypothetical protein
VLKRILLFNLLLAAVYAVVLFVLVYAAAWQILSGSFGNRPRQFESSIILHETLSDVARFRDVHGKFPADLTDPEIAHNAVRPGTTEKSGPLDGWKNPLTYEVHGDGVTICSLGRDGARGGAGLDADICGRVSTDPETRFDAKHAYTRSVGTLERPTFQQFLTTRDPQELSGNGVLMWASLSGVLAFGLMLITSWPIIRRTLDGSQFNPALIARYEKQHAFLDSQAPAGDRAAALLSYGTSAILLILVSILFAGVITFFHIQSGH